MPERKKMTEANQDVANFTKFMQDFSPLVSGSEAFLSTLLTEKTISQLLDAAKSVKNSSKKYLLINKKGEQHHDTICITSP